MHVEKDNGKFFVRGICQQGKREDRKWYLFAEDDQDPKYHPLMKSQIQRLKIKNFRSFTITKERLKPCLTADEKTFHFKNIPLIADLEKTIEEAQVQSSDEEQETTYKKARTSTSKQKAKRLRTSFKPITQAKGPSFANFLKGHEIIKEMKLKAFDPFKDNAENWISAFEKEFQLHASVEDLGFTNLLHLMESQKVAFKTSSKVLVLVDLQKRVHQRFQRIFCYQTVQAERKI